MSDVEKILKLIEDQELRFHEIAEEALPNRAMWEIWNSHANGARWCARIIREKFGGIEPTLTASSDDNVPPAS